MDTTRVGGHRERVHPIEAEDKETNPNTVQTGEGSLSLLVQMVKLSVPTYQSGGPFSFHSPQRSKTSFASPVIMDTP